MDCYLRGTRIIRADLAVPSETDLDAYVASVKRIATLAPQFEGGAGRAQHSRGAASGVAETGDGDRGCALRKRHEQARGRGAGDPEHRRIFFSLAGAVGFRG